jgi:hypothetical protein
MKKALAMIALAAICMVSTASAFTPVRAVQDTTKKDTSKMKMKKKGSKMKMKKKMKDTTKM